MEEQTPRSVVMVEALAAAYGLGVSEFCLAIATAVKGYKQLRERQAERVEAEQALAETREQIGSLEARLVTLRAQSDRQQRDLSSKTTLVEDLSAVLGRLNPALFDAEKSQAAARAVTALYTESAAAEPDGPTRAMVGVLSGHPEEQAATGGGGSASVEADSVPGGETPQQDEG